ncbi:MAG: hypothetical protein GX131_05725 [candidate division WS1 bacterium]|jgi:hypothetical protein|nr:hypothetical protein [candidate division WS1 bacterium]
MEAFLRDRFPYLAEEIAGIGEGAQIGSDAARHLSFFSASRVFTECTNLGFCTSDRGPLHAKTFDIGNQHDVYVLHRVVPEHGYRYFRVNWAGNVWAPTGINEHGLAVGSSSTPAIPDQDPCAMPWHMTMNVVLRECATVQEALALLAETPLAGKGHNYGLMDANGDGAIVEKCGDRQGIIRPERDVTCCANHYTTEPLREFVAGDGPGRQSSLDRLAWMRRSFIEADPQPPLTLDALIGAVRNSEGDGRLCRKGFAGGHTHYAMVYICRERTVLVSDGYPCDTPFIAHRL